MLNSVNREELDQKKHQERQAVNVWLRSNEKTYISLLAQLIRLLHVETSLPFVSETINFGIFTYDEVNSRKIG